MRPKLLVAVAAIAVAVAACSSSSKSSSAPATNTTSTSVVPAPAGLPAFYSFNEPIPSKPGTIIKSEKLAAPNLKGTVYRVIYTSTDVDNHPVPVSGIIIVPGKTAPAGGYRVVTWGHGTNGMADKCAPSLTPEDSVPLTNMLLDQGWVLTSSDYQGEGTPGVLPYIAGESAARNVIDIARAAKNLPGVKVSNDYVTWGHSEGGQTAMYALHIGPTYAPELHLKGVVAGAPPSQFNLIYVYLQGSPFKYYLLMAAGGLNKAYGNRAPLDEVLKPRGVALIPQLDKGCADYVEKLVRDIKVADLTKQDPFTVPKWKKILEANDPQQFKTKSPAPLLIIQGANDEQIPPVSTEILAKHLCGLGQDLERWIYPGQSHAGVIGPSAGDMVHWIADRFAGKANPDPYKPTGLPDVQVTTTCP
jgi:pimeloyl-ACP methyl ester carboxylesterase